MAFIPDRVIEEIRDRFDIVEIISMYVDLKKTGRNYTGLCPFHAEKTPSFTVFPETQTFYCFGCQSGGNHFNFIMQIENLGFYEAVSFLGEKAGIRIGDHIFTPEEKKEQLLKEKMYELLQKSGKYFEEMLWKDHRGKEAYSYLSDRGVSDDSIKAFGLGFAADNWNGLTGRLQSLRLEMGSAYQAGLLGKKNSRYYDYFRGRIIFPIQDQHGRIIAFGGRMIGVGEPKYLNSPETPLFHKSKALYGLHMALPQIRSEKEAVLVEGYLDVILLHQYGVKTAIAPLGTALTEKHAALLRGRLEKITLVFDGDPAGEKAALRGLKLFKNEGCQVKIAELPAGMDPADYILQKGKESFCRDILDKAKSLIEYQVSLYKKNLNLQKEEDRLQYWREARRILAELPEMLEREYYLKKIAGEIGISLEVLRGDLEKSIARKGTPEKKPHIQTEKTDQGLNIKELAEKELLSSVLQDPALNWELWKQTKPDFFTSGVLQEIAGGLYSLFLEHKEAGVSVLLGYFTDREIHKLITEMAIPIRRGEDTRARKRMNDCLKKLRLLHLAEERGKIIQSMKAMREETGVAEISASLQRLQDLKAWEEELHHPVGGEKVDG